MVDVERNDRQLCAPRSRAAGGGKVLVLASVVLFLIVSLGEGLRAAPSPRTLARSDVTAPVHETLEGLLRGTLDVLGFNQHILSRLRALSSVGLLYLARVHSSLERASPNCYCRSHA